PVVVHTFETTSTVLRSSSWRIAGCWLPSGESASRIVCATWRRSPESESTSASSHSTPRVERREAANGIATGISWHRIARAWATGGILLRGWIIPARCAFYDGSHDRSPNPTRARRRRRDHPQPAPGLLAGGIRRARARRGLRIPPPRRSEEHTSELQSRFDLV